jgi:cytoskeletal protein CcmA (bactofilin family)
VNVLARISKVSEFPGADQVEAPQRPAPNSQERPGPKSGRSYGPSIISAALTVTGRLESAGDIQIDGKVEGDVRGQTVRIGDGATVKGTIMGALVELAGTIEGKIEAESVALTKTACMSGDIIHRSLRIDTGAHFDGNSRPHYAKNVTKITEPMEARPAPIGAPPGNATFGQI